MIDVVSLDKPIWCLRTFFNISSDRRCKSPSRNASAPHAHNAHSTWTRSRRLDSSLLTPIWIFSPRSSGSQVSACVFQTSSWASTRGLSWSERGSSVSLGGRVRVWASQRAAVPRPLSLGETRGSHRWRRTMLPDAVDAWLMSTRVSASVVVSSLDTFASGLSGSSNLKAATHQPAAGGARSCILVHKTSARSWMAINCLPKSKTSFLNEDASLRRSFASLPSLWACRASGVP
mmetsp:Transcript_5362/g.15966  ORF Transcript_5362/g.15966 Transcript_5362/m.15966 type:complete len:233 (+) Transcript_5362:4118-4816(+)